MEHAFWGMSGPGSVLAPHALCHVDLGRVRPLTSSTVLTYRAETGRYEQ
jgi:hypothetical protein